MDPYLEDDAHWRSFHHHFVLSLYQHLLPVLPDRYRARVEQRTYATEQALFTSIIREQHQEDYLEVRQRSDNRLVTLIDCPSPTNKLSTQGRTAYHATRKEGRSAGASLVEIDLVLRGQALLDYSREGLPDWDYAVSVSRSTQPDRYEIYTATVQKRLPRFRLPLAADDRDTVLDLSTVFTRAFDQGGFAKAIDYKRDPSAPLSDANKRWLGELLKQAKMR
jgi:hypothetical protein